MNTTVRTRRSSPGPATQRGRSPRSPRQAAGATLPSRPALPATTEPGPQPQARSVRRAGQEPGRQQAGRRASSAAQAAERRHASRTRFVLLVIGVLAGGLACLLVINTTLAAGSYRIGKLQQDNTAASQQLQQLQQQVAAEQSAASIQQRALRLGMRPQQVLNFVDLQTGQRYSTAANLPPMYDVPGYTP